MDRICLLGFMGAGKSYWGKRLAAALDWDFVDLDIYIEQQTNLSIPQLFESYGESYFRQLEQTYLKEWLLKKEVVIALGGGSPCFFDNMEQIKQQSLSVFLNPPLEIILQRLILDRVNRPLVAQHSESSLKEFIEELYQKRLSFYLQAQLELKQSSQVLEKILDYYEKEKN